ncbi:hypothetical protein CEXT_334801 [Caerostris extrusa]|uniref:Uncharacterized protein n=1 Tax=Caerostris extrusa TaxID=172846 RepID=A0AAV4UZW3_CAEEX|nr:hypothetical protein CEXT_334801 [Caerostris extrusa]
MIDDGLIGDDGYDCDDESHLFVLKRQFKLKITQPLEPRKWKNTKPRTSSIKRSHNPQHKAKQRTTDNSPLLRDSHTKSKSALVKRNIYMFFGLDNHLRHLRGEKRVRYLEKISVRFHIKIKIDHPPSMNNGTGFTVEDSTEIPVIMTPNGTRQVNAARDPIWVQLERILKGLFVFFV